MKLSDIAFYVFMTVFVGGSIIGMIWAGVVGTRDDDHCDRECQPFNRVDRFRSDGKLFTVCRDIDGGFQIREVK